MAARKKASKKKSSKTPKKSKKPVARKAASKKKVVKKKAVKKAAGKKARKVVKKKGISKNIKTAKKKVAKKGSAKTKKLAKKAVIKKVVKTKAVKKSAAPKKPVVKASETKGIGHLKAGDKAPDFSLQNQDGQVVNLSDFFGKQSVVLYFYPRAMTPGCTVQACGIRDHADLFKQADAVVLGVSPDKVPSLEKFRQRDHLNFDLLADTDKSLAKAYGVWGLKKFMGREFMGVLRWTFIIGKDGTIKHIMDQVNTKTHHEDVLAVLKTL